jgi:DNA invertase Pin-like site-specific DNA recombinase
MPEEDTIGVVRDHRWLSMHAQAKRLEESGCRIIVALNSGGKWKQVDFEALARLVRATTTVKCVHLFLLAQPKRFAMAMKRELAARVKELERKGATVMDVDLGLTTEAPAHRKAVLAVANEMIARDRQGAKSGLNGAQSKGRPAADFTPDQYREAKAIWRDRIDYPRWADVDAALAKIKDAKGNKFTSDRAFRKWGGRS